MRAAEAGGSGRNYRVAVVARGHVLSEGFVRLVDGLAGGDRYDLYVATNDQRGPIVVGDHPRIPYTTADIGALGYRAPEEESFFGHNCADAVFEHIARALPRYDYYIHVEYDVWFRGGGRAFLEELIEVLEGAETPIDLVGTLLFNKDGSTWVRYVKAQQVFPHTWSIFYPLMVLSKRAVHFLHGFRLGLEPLDAPSRDRVHCEEFTPSALKLAGYRVEDLRDLMPGSYKAETFNPGPAMLDGSPGVALSETRVLHPVYDAAQHLKRHLPLARDEGTLRTLIAGLAGADLPIADELRSQHLAEAQALLAASPAAAQAPGDLDGAPVLLLPGAASRAGQADAAAWLSRVGDRPLAAHVLERLRAAGAGPVALAAGPEQAAALRRAAADEAAGHLRSILLDGEAPDREEPLVAVYGDSLADIDFTALLEAHRAAGKAVTLTSGRSSTWLRSLEGRILHKDLATALSGKAGRLNAGFYVLERRAADAFIAAARAGAEAEWLRARSERGEVAVYDHPGFWQSGETALGRSVLQAMWDGGDPPWVAVDGSPQSASPVQARARSVERA